MSRYSPTVLPRAFDFGGILERALQGYRYGRGLRREREEGREREEDRRLLRSRMRREDLSQPGAATLGEYLEAELGAGREPLTEETLRRVGRADEPDVELEFRRPEPTTVTLPGGETRQFQERAPFTTETGVVIDPRRAREERGLAAYLDASMLREPTRKPWEREGFETEPEYLGYLGRKRKAEPPREARPPITLNQALDAVEQLYGTWDKERGKYTYPFPEERAFEIARSMVMGGETIPPAYPRTGPSPWGGGAGDLLRRDGGGGRAGGADREGAEPEPRAPAGAASRRAVPPRASPDTGVDRYSRAVADSIFADSVRTGRRGVARAVGELRLSAEQQAKYNDLLDQGWAPGDVVNELAADEWDRLVAGGMARGEATRQVARKYHVQWP